MSIALPLRRAVTWSLWTPVGNWPGAPQRRKQGVVLQQMSIPRSNLPNEREFLEAFKGACARIMGLNGWLSVDTPTPV